MKLPASEELELLDKFPELAKSEFPFRGHPDFRKFTGDDYDYFSAGIFQNTGDARKCKWFGGIQRFAAAYVKLRDSGYRLRLETPTANEDGKRWWVIHFTPKTIPADYIPEEPLSI